MTGMRERALGWSRRVALVALIIAGSILASSDPFTLLLFEAYAAVGAFLAMRRPRNAIGWLLVAIAFGFISTTYPGVDIDALIRGDATPHDAIAAWLSAWSGWALYVGFLGLTIIFPSGRLPETRGRRTALVLLGGGVAVVALTAAAPTIGMSPDGVATIYVPNPFAVLPDLPVWPVLPTENGAVVAVISLLFLGVVRMVLRFRHATGIERLQLRWLVAAVSFVASAIGFGLFTILVFGETLEGLGWIPAMIAFPTIPLSIGVAVMRYRLFEIDRIISRTIGWAVVTGLLIAVLVGGVIALQAVLTDVTQGQTLAVAASTLVAVALFQPVRRRVQRAVDRRFDRARYDGEQTAAAFAVRMRGQVDLAGLEFDITGTVRAALRPSSAAIWIRGTVPVPSKSRIP